MRNYLIFKYLLAVKSPTSPVHNVIVVIRFRMYEVKCDHIERGWKF